MKGLIVKEILPQSEIQWLKLAGALLLIFAAVYLPAVAAESAGSVIAVSAALSAVGGALLADSFVTARRFMKTISPRLNSINRLLATITSQISSIIVQEKGATGEHLVISRLSEIVPSLRAIIADINDLAGEKFDPKIINETIDSIGEVITQLERGKIKPNSETLTVFLKTLRDNLKQESPAGIRTSVDCPYTDCDGKTEVELGEYPSTSRVVGCDKCHNKFHAHRTSDGAVETKEWGANKAA
ncbi:hypothetical protein [Nitrosomonas mobilis]|uniref:Uncharacterized protein n=1 Tax=Nitrosomonas mobilis TaxID=51642 RepID=A0A1G5SDW8_9PROT|nr:hypothetical protein [Nitrosomonas mobilis]SCZ85383.1 exported hypothetical protein [Nitrosomonas mobilis]